MDRDVDLVLVRDLFEALVEVLHVLDEERSTEVEVALLIFAIVNNVDHNAVLEVGALYVRQQIRSRLLLTCSGTARRAIVVTRGATGRSTGH